MPPAICVGDMHACPLSDGPKPHGGGPISLGSGNRGTVTFNGKPAALVGDIIPCVGPPNMIASGSTSVTINGKPVVRVGDQTGHGIPLAPPTGQRTVNIGG